MTQDLCAKFIFKIRFGDDLMKKLVHYFQIDTKFSLVLPCLNPVVLALTPLQFKHQGRTHELKGGV